MSIKRGKEVVQMLGYDEYEQGNAAGGPGGAAQGPGRPGHPLK